MEDRDQIQADVAKVVAMAWSDASFKAKLLNDSAAALIEAGIDVPSHVTVKVFENTRDTYHIIIPAAPEQELSDDDLEKVSGGLMPYL
ncbi:MAG: NHLP leader peptide family RiPP precursor [Pseudomonadota bacterium]